MAKRITIKDIAERTGVSTHTVSNVINGRGRMRPATRARIQQAMDDLGYRVNPSARSLKTGRTHTIGVAVPNPHLPFFLSYITPIITAARSHGYRVAITVYEDTAEGLQGLSEEAHRLAADGWLYYLIHPLGNNLDVLRQDFPLVVWGDCLTDGLVDQIILPYTESFEQATDLLVSKGCTRIAMLGAPSDMYLNDWQPPREGGSRLRYAGYRQALLRHGFALDNRLLNNTAPWTRRGGALAMRAMLDAGTTPDGLVCATDTMAFGAMRELSARGISIPDDVKVIGFDNSDDCRYSTPTLTSIDTRQDRTAEIAVEQLIRRIEGDRSPFVRIVPDFSIEQRESTAD